LQDLDSSKVSEALKQIRAHKVVPGLFGRYFDLVLELTQGNHQVAVELFGQILEGSIHEPDRLLLRFGPKDLNNDQERYARLVDLGGENPGFLATPGDDAWQRIERELPQAQQLIEQADTGLRAELDGLVCQVIAAAPLSTPNVRQFGGASSLMLWGAIVINAQSHDNPVKLAEGLVHEATHHLLFALSKDEPLVINAIEGSFDSPLRSDDRPLDGVYHATFVCARLVYFYRCLTKLPNFTWDESAALTSLASVYQKRFQQGLATVRKEARLTSLGATLIDGAEAAIK
jgi:HEXXH motif-containing protein